MTTYYLDSSALVKRYAIEVGTAWVRTLCEQLVSADGDLLKAAQGEHLTIENPSDYS
jgi:hypothetical protein